MVLPFDCFKSIHTLIASFFFGTTRTGAHQSVGSSTFSITAIFCMPCNSAKRGAFHAADTHLGTAWANGGILGSSFIFKSLGMHPSPVKSLGIPGPIPTRDLLLPR